MLELGTIVGKYVQEVPAEVLTTSVPGKCYHLRIETSGISDEMLVSDALITGLSKNFKAKVKYMRIENGVIDVQLEGSPFIWAEVLLWLPAMFTVFGIILVGISVYTVFASIPSWAWGTLIVGVVLLLLAPSAGRMFGKR